MDEDVEGGSRRGHPMDREESRIIAMERNKRRDAKERREDTETKKRR